METRLSGAQTAIGREGEAGPMLKPLTCWLAISVAMAATVEARANDSSAELSAGGLALTKNDAIELRAEDLSISSKQVRVNYRFFNTTSAPVQIVVAFPLPDVTYEGIDDVIAIPEASAPENFLGFATTVNGQPVVARVEQKVFAKDVERTNELRELGVPLAPYLERLRDRLDALPLESREKLVELGLAVKETEYEGEKPIVHLNPTWTLKTTYYWDQVFPPGETKIEHRCAKPIRTRAIAARSTNSTSTFAHIAWTTASSRARGVSRRRCRRRGRWSSGAFPTSSRPRRTGRARSGISTSSSISNIPTISSASAAKACARSGRRRSK
jgi:hypothetical protein